MKSIPDFVNEKMDIILSDFKQSLKTENNYCKLKELRFDKKTFPKYEDVVVQQYYLLKYLPAYMAEYYTIYKGVIASKFLGDKFNVLSIGCGCYLDLWGLNFATHEQSHKYEIDSYTGVDAVNWKYRDNVNVKVNFINKDVDSIESFNSNDYNIIIFPKSIAEFDDEKFETLKKAISKSKFSSDRLIMISSLRMSNYEYDRNRFKDIAYIMSKDHYYSCKDSVIKCTTYPKKENGFDYRLYEVIDGLNYPEDVYEYLKNLYNGCCVIKNPNIECVSYFNNECKNLFDRNPVTTMSQVNYQIVRFERR